MACMKNVYFLFENWYCNSYIAQNAVGVSGSAIFGNFLCGLTVLEKILHSFFVLSQFYCGSLVPEFPAVRHLFFYGFSVFFSKSSIGFSVSKYFLVCHFCRIFACFGVFWCVFWTILFTTGENEKKENSLS